jgi:beta-phosphoglucomutase-like phosphatase (HAD superfamily)
VKRAGRNAKAPLVYKKGFNHSLDEMVKERLAHLEAGQAAVNDFAIRGAQAFLAGLAARGVTLYLASGSDHHSVLHEAEVLGVLDYFAGHVYGALDKNDAHAKDRVLDRILAAGCRPEELLVVGDGVVEIHEGAVRGAFGLGIVSDEVDGGWNEAKVPRLVSAGADLLVANYEHAGELIELFCSKRSNP